MRRCLIVLVVCLTAPAWAQTIAVLPFFNLSGDSGLDWVGESASEAIREFLVAEGAYVLDRSGREEAYRQLSLRPYILLTRASVVKLGESLDAQQIVYGGFKVTGEKRSMSLWARVLNRRELSLSAEETVDSPLEDLPEAQDRLARRMFELLGRSGESTLKAARPKPVRVDALESYIRGLMASSPEQKHRLLTQAARLDGTFTLPCFELGRLLLASKDYRAAAGWFQRVPPDHPRGLEAAFYLGLCQFELSEYDAAIAALSRVAETTPLSEVWNNLGAAQSRRNLPEALDSFRKAQARTPTDPDYLFNLGYALWRRSEFDEGAEKFRAVLDRTPEDEQAISMLGRCLQKTPPRDNDLRMLGLERVKDRLDQKESK
jgi:tetratricopeptide (TPR) repeat protein